MCSLSTSQQITETGFQDVVARYRAALVAYAAGDLPFAAVIAAHGGIAAAADAQRRDRRQRFVSPQKETRAGSRTA